jgi:hypothetical protein
MNLNKYAHNKIKKQKRTYINTDNVHEFFLHFQKIVPYCMEG